MKQIENKVFSPDGAEPLSAARLLAICLRTTPPQGFDFDTIRLRLRIQDALDATKEGEPIKLEDADYKEAVNAIKQTRWAKPERHLLEFAQLFGL